MCHIFHHNEGVCTTSKRLFTLASHQEVAWVHLPRHAVSALRCAGGGFSDKKDGSGIHVSREVIDGCSICAWRVNDQNWVGGAVAERPRPDLASRKP